MEKMIIVILENFKNTVSLPMFMGKLRKYEKNILLAVKYAAEEISDTKETVSELIDEIKLLSPEESDIPDFLIITFAQAEEIIKSGEDAPTIRKRLKERAIYDTVRDLFS